MITRYKVVAKRYGEPGVGEEAVTLHSMWAMGKLDVKYTPDKSTKAPIGGLLVFKSLRDAMLYSRTEGHHNEVWKVEVRDRVRLPKLRVNIFSLTLNKKIKTVWSYGKLLNELTSTWPGGTQAFKQVKLLERVK